MDTSGANEIAVLVPVLPHGVAPCKDIPRSAWYTKCVTLRNESAVEVAKGICHSIDANLIIDMDKKPLGDNRNAIQVAESLCEAEVPSSWMWSMRSWPISRVYLNGASLYDRDQIAIFKATVNASRRRVTPGVRTYVSARERRESCSLSKKEALFTPEAIAEVSSKSCCAKNCLQPFPRGQIQAIRSQIHVEGGVYWRKSRLLDVHKQMHHDVDGKDMITLAAHEVCLVAWCTIHGVSKATFYRYKE